ncbi:MAG: MFS transporter [Thermodesulfovibrionales bacterium]
MAYNRFNGVNHAFRALRHRNYRLFFLGQGISLIGTWMQQIALSWLVYRLSNSAVLLGVVGFATRIPTFLVAPLAGVLADRWNRRRLLILIQSLAMAQAFILSFFVLSGTITVWLIIVLGLFLGCVNSFDIPVRQSFVLDMLENKEDLGNAIALNSSLVNGARLLGPSVAGILIATVGEGMCFLINGMSYIAVIAALFAMRILPRQRATDQPTLVQNLKEGFSYTFGFPPIRDILLLLALVSLLGMPYVTLMPVFARDILHGGSHTFGFLMGATGIGALIGAMCLAARKTVAGLGPVIAIAAGVFGAGLVTFSFSRLLWLSLGLMVMTGFGMMVQMAASNTVLQTIADDEKRGRVMSFYTVAFIGMTPFGSLLSGWAASWFGVRITVFLSGIFCAIGGLIFAVRLPGLHEMVGPIYERKGIASRKKTS